MKKRLLALTLALVLTLALLPTAALAAQLPQAGIRDMRSCFWTQFTQAKPEPNEPVIGGGVFGVHYADSNEYLSYSATYSGLYSMMSVANFILYDNGELYFSDEVEPSERSFHKVMDNVKAIGEVDLPAYLVHIKNQHRKNFNTAGWGDYSTGSYSDYLYRVTLTTILTQDGDLYLMGIPREIPEENLTLSYANPAGGTYGYQYRSSVTAECLFPIAFADSQEEPVRVAQGIAHIDPGYAYRVTISNKYSGSSTPSSYAQEGSNGFYVTTKGESFAGFPLEGANNQKLASNVVNYIPKDNIQLLEDGTLKKAGQTVARDVKDFNRSYYLTSDGTVYNYDKKRIGSDVAYLVGTGGSGYWMETLEDGTDVRIMRSEGLFIQNDASLWVYNSTDKKAEKVMEDVAAAFLGYVVRTNGDVYQAELEGGFHKLFSGNGIAPDPAPAIHAGKIFKDASSWALVDLRAARDSGLTIPTDGLSYNTPITREKFAEVAVKLYEALSGKKAPAATQNPFTDTKNPEILKAYSLGIVKGTGEGKFSPDARIDRESIAVMLLRAVNAGGARLNKGAAVSFSDASAISPWAKDSVDAMAKASVIRGVGGSRFDPKGTATVEQAIIMANRILP